MQLSSSMHFRSKPLSNIRLPISELKLSFSLHESFKEITLICRPVIFPCDFPLALLEPEFKMPIVDKIFLLFNSHSVLFIVNPLAIVSVSIHMHESTFWWSLEKKNEEFFKTKMIAANVWFFLKKKEIKTHNFILYVTISVNSVLFPITLVVVSIRMNQPSFAICHIVHPVTLINRSIRPNLNASSMSLSLIPLTFINSICN